MATQKWGIEIQKARRRVNLSAATGDFPEDHYSTTEQEQKLPSTSLWDRAPEEAAADRRVTGFGKGGEDVGGACRSRPVTSICRENVNVVDALIEEA